MKWNAKEILSILDQCCKSFTFPMLDNGYVYLAATRMSLYRSEQDWATVIEVFGFSPRAGYPDVHIYTFASKLHNRNPAVNYVSAQAYENYLSNNPHNESRFIYPIEAGAWQDSEDPELLAGVRSTVIVRGKEKPTPQASDYAVHGITLGDPLRVRTFEFCRALAATDRDDVLASEAERRVSVLPEMQQILQLESWNHPDVIDERNLPSNSETFRQLAMILVNGDISQYRPTTEPNTHWKNWPDGGSL